MSLPYDWYPAALSAINMLSQGMTKSMACDKSQISIATFDTYVKNDPQLQMLFIEAEQRGHDAMADALLQPDNHTLYGQSNPQMAKVMSDNIKWFLSKKNPKDFGDKIEIRHEITLDRAITDAMDRAKSRANGQTVIEHDPKEMMPVAITTSIIKNVVDVVTEDEEIMAELLG